MLNLTLKDPIEISLTKSIADFEKGMARILHSAQADATKQPLGQPTVTQYMPSLFVQPSVTDNKKEQRFISLCSSKENLSEQVKALIDSAKTDQSKGNRRLQLLRDRLDLLKEQERLITNFQRDISDSPNLKDTDILLKATLNNLSNQLNFHAPLPEEVPHLDQWELDYTACIIATHKQALDRLYSVFSKHNFNPPISHKITWNSVNKYLSTITPQSRYFLRLQKLLLEDWNSTCSSDYPKPNISVKQLSKEYENIRAEISGVTNLIVQTAVKKGGIDSETLEYIDYVGKTFGLTPLKDISELAKKNEPNLGYELQRKPKKEVDIRYLASLQGVVTDRLGELEAELKKEKDKKPTPDIDEKINKLQSEKEKLLMAHEWINTQLSRYVENIKVPEIKKQTETIISDKLQAALINKNFTDESKREQFLSEGLSNVFSNMLLGEELVIVCRRTLEPSRLAEFRDVLSKDIIGRINELTPDDKNLLEKIRKASLTKKDRNIKNNAPPEYSDIQNIKLKLILQLETQLQWLESQITSYEKTEGKKISLLKPKGTSPSAEETASNAFIEDENIKKEQESRLKEAASNASIEVEFWMNTPIRLYSVSDKAEKPNDLNELGARFALPSVELELAKVDPEVAARLCARNIGFLLELQLDIEKELAGLDKNNSRDIMMIRGCELRLERIKKLIVKEEASLEKKKAEADQKLDEDLQRELQNELKGILDNQLRIYNQNKVADFERKRTEAREENKSARQDSMTRARQEYRRPLVHGILNQAKDLCNIINSANYGFGFDNGKVVSISQELADMKPENMPKASQSIQDKRWASFYRIRDELDIFYAKIKNKSHEKLIQESNTKLHETISEPNLRDIISAVYIDPNMKLRGFTEGRAETLVTRFKYGRGREVGGQFETTIKNQFSELFDFANTSSGLLSWDSAPWDSQTEHKKVQLNFSINKDKDSSTASVVYSQAEIDLILGNLIAYDRTGKYIPGDIVEDPESKPPPTSFEEMDKGLSELAKLHSDLASILSTGRLLFDPHKKIIMPWNESVIFGRKNPSLPADMKKLAQPLSINTIIERISKLEVLIKEGSPIEGCPAEIQAEIKKIIENNESITKISEAAAFYIVLGEIPSNESLSNCENSIKNSINKLCLDLVKAVIPLNSKLRQVKQYLASTSSNVNLPEIVRKHLKDTLYNLERLQELKEIGNFVEFIEKKIGQTSEVAQNTLGQYYAQNPDTVPFEQLSKRLSTKLISSFPEINSIGLGSFCEKNRADGYKKLAERAGILTSRLNYLKEAVVNLVRAEHPTTSIFNTVPADCLSIFLCAMASVNRQEKFRELSQIYLSTLSETDRDSQSQKLNELEKLLDSREILAAISELFKMWAACYESYGSNKSLSDLLSYAKKDKQKHADFAEIFPELLEIKIKIKRIDQICHDNREHIEMLYSMSLNDSDKRKHNAMSSRDFLYDNWRENFYIGIRNQKMQAYDEWEQKQTERNKDFFARLYDRAGKGVSEIPLDFLERVTPVLPGLYHAYLGNGAQYAGELIYNIHRIRRYTLDGTSVYGTTKDFASTHMLPLIAWNSQPVTFFTKLVDAPFNTLDLLTEYVYAKIIGKDYSQAMHLKDVDINAAQTYLNVGITSEGLQNLVALATVWGAAGKAVAAEARLAKAGIAVSRTQAVLHALKYGGGFGLVISASEEFKNDNPDFIRKEYGLSFLKNTKYSTIFMGLFGLVRYAVHARALRFLDDANDIARITKAESMLKGMTRFLKIEDFIDALNDCLELLPNSLLQLIAEYKRFSKSEFTGQSVNRFLSQNAGFVLGLVAVGSDFLDNLPIHSTVFSNKEIISSLEKRTGLSHEELKKEMPALLSIAEQNLKKALTLDPRLVSYNISAVSNLAKAEKGDVCDTPNGVLCKNEFVNRLANLIEGKAPTTQNDFASFIDYETGIRVINSSLSLEEIQIITSSYLVYDTKLEEVGDTNVALQFQVNYLEKNGFTMDLSTHNAKIKKGQSNITPDIIAAWTKKHDEIARGNIENALRAMKDNGIFGIQCHRVTGFTTQFLDKHNVAYTVEPNGDIRIIPGQTSRLSALAEINRAKGKTTVFVPENYLNRMAGCEHLIKRRPDIAEITELDIEYETAARTQGNQDLQAFKAMLASKLAPKGKPLDNFLLGKICHNGTPQNISSILTDHAILTQRAKLTLDRLTGINSISEFEDIVEKLDREVQITRRVCLDQLQSTLTEIGEKTGNTSQTTNRDPRDSLEFRFEPKPGDPNTIVLIGSFCKDHSSGQRIEFALCSGDRISMTDLEINLRGDKAIENKFAESALSKLHQLSEMCTKIDRDLRNLSAALKKFTDSKSTSTDEKRELLASALETLPGCKLKTSSIQTLLAVYLYSGLSLLPELLFINQGSPPDDDDKSPKIVKPTIDQETKPEKPKPSNLVLTLPPPLDSNNKQIPTYSSDVPDLDAVDKAHLETLRRLMTDKYSVYVDYISEHDIKNERLKIEIAFIALQKDFDGTIANLKKFNLDPNGSQEGRYRVALRALLIDPVKTLEAENFKSFRLRRPEYIDKIVNYVTKRNPKALWGLDRPYINLQKRRSSPSNLASSQWDEPDSNRLSPIVERMTDEQKLAVLENLAVIDTAFTISALPQLKIGNQQDIFNIIAYCLRRDPKETIRAISFYSDDKNFLEHAGLKDPLLVASLTKLFFEIAESSKSPFPSFIPNLHSQPEKERYGLVLLYIKNNRSMVENNLASFGFIPTKDPSLFSEEQRIALAQELIRAEKDFRLPHISNLIKELKLKDKKQLAQVVSEVLIQSPILIRWLNEFGISSQELTQNISDKKLREVFEAAYKPRRVDQQTRKFYDDFLLSQLADNAEKILKDVPIDNNNLIYKNAARICDKDGNLDKLVDSYLGKEDYSNAFLLASAFGKIKPAELIKVKEYLESKRQKLANSKTPTSNLH